MNNIKKVREEKGLTQIELGERLGWSAAQVSNYERGWRNPKIGTLRKIAKALDTPVESLL